MFQNHSFIYHLQMNNALYWNAQFVNSYLPTGKCNGLMIIDEMFDLYWNIHSGSKLNSKGNISVIIEKIWNHTFTEATIVVHVECLNIVH